MDDSQIFGPLTLRQFLYVAGGVIVCFIVYDYFDAKISTPVIVFVAGACISLIMNAPRVVLNEEYIQKKKATSPTPEVFDRWVRFKIAMIESQVYARKNKRLVSDPKLDAALKLLRSFRAKPEVEKVTPWFKEPPVK
jgi:hypothetical protein